MPPMSTDPTSATGTAPAGRRTLTVLLAVVAVVLVVRFLKDTHSVTMPLAAAAFVAMLVHPVQGWVAARLPAKHRWAGTAVAMLVVLAVLALFAGAIGLAVAMAADRAPQYAVRVQQAWQDFAGWASARGLPVRQMGGGGGGLDQAVQWLTRGVRSTTNSLALLVLVLFFVLLMLSELPRWGEKVRAGLAAGRAGAVLDTAAVTARRMRSYLLVRTAVGAITAAAEGLWLWLAGVDLALVWALLFFFLNYVPTVGSVVAAVPPALVALVTLGPGRAALAVGGIVVIEQVMGNFVDPKLVGRRLSLSPLVVMVAVVFWGWVWGVAGALLAVPMTATLVIAMAHSDRLRPIALLLSRSADERELQERTHAR